MGRQLGHRHPATAAALMDLKWTNKALSELARLYDFLAPVNKTAAGRTIQSLTSAPASLLANPRTANDSTNSNRAKSGASSPGTTKCATRFAKQHFTCCDSGIHAKIGRQQAGHGKPLAIRHDRSPEACRRALPPPISAFPQPYKPHSGPASRSRQPARPAACRAPRSRGDNRYCGV